MKKNRIIPIVTALLFALVLASCAKEEEKKLLIDQKKAFETYLKSRNLAYTETANVYKALLTPIEEAVPEAQVGDSLYFYYALYTFSSTGLHTLVDTNIEEIAEYSSLNINFLDFSPRKILLGNHDVFPGMEIGMITTKVGEEFLLLIPSELGYGRHWNGYVAPDTPLYLEIIPIKIIKDL